MIPVTNMIAVKNRHDFSNSRITMMGIIIAINEHTDMFGTMLALSLAYLINATLLMNYRIFDKDYRILK